MEHTMIWSHYRTIAPSTRLQALRLRLRCRLTNTFWPISILVITSTITNLLALRCVHRLICARTWTQIMVGTFIQSPLRHLLVHIPRRRALILVLTLHHHHLIIVTRVGAIIVNFSFLFIVFFFFYWFINLTTAFNYNYSTWMYFEYKSNGLF